MKEYELIKSYYKDRCAARSKVPLINHIDEGLRILEFLNADEVIWQAYCLHPFLQNDEDFNINKFIDWTGVNVHALILAMEYRRVANSYLSKDDMSKFVGISCREVAVMLIADKVQNYKDFMLHHRKTHERSDALFQYFHNWFKKILGIDINYYLTKEYEYTF